MQHSSTNLNPNPNPQKDCCPEGSLPAVPSDPTYITKGEYVDIDGLSIYITGNQEAKSAIIVAHDVFGPNSGRTIEICDEIAQRMKILVILPDFFHGNPFFPESYGTHSISGAIASFVDLFIYGNIFQLLFSSNKRSTWTVVGNEFESIVIPMLQKRNISKIGILGFCWGGWFGIHASSNPYINCVVAFHPSLNVCYLVGEDRQKLCDTANCPLLMLTAGNDFNDVKEGGMLHEAINKTKYGDSSVFSTIPTMIHGWVNRGDTSIDTIKVEVEGALNEAVTFLSKHL